MRRNIGTGTGYKRTIVATTLARGRYLIRHTVRAYALGYSTLTFGLYPKRRGEL